MADTATYAGAMKTSYPDTTRRTAKKRGDRRPGSLKGGMPIGVHRAAAQRRAGQANFQRPGQK